MDELISIMKVIAETSNELDFLINKDATVEDVEVTLQHALVLKDQAEAIINECNKLLRPYQGDNGGL